MWRAKGKFLFSDENLVSKNSETNCSSRGVRKLEETERRKLQGFSSKKTSHAIRKEGDKTERDPFWRGKKRRIHESLDEISFGCQLRESDNANCVQFHFICVTIFPLFFVPTAKDGSEFSSFPSRSNFIDREYLLPRSIEGKSTESRPGWKEISRKWNPRSENKRLVTLANPSSMVERKQATQLFFGVPPSSPPRRINIRPSERGLLTKNTDQ